MSQWFAEMEDAGSPPGLPPSMLSPEQGGGWNGQVAWLPLGARLCGYCQHGLQAFLHQAGVTDLSKGIWVFKQHISIWDLGLKGKGDRRRSKEGKQEGGSRRELGSRA